MVPPWVPAGVLLLYAVLIAVWRWLVLRWGLAGPMAPPPGSLSRSEYLARRSLRALLAFDFLLVLPIAVPACIALLVMAAEPSSDLDPGIFFFPLSVLAFLLPVPALRRSIRRMEQQRIAGEVVEPEAPPNTSGLAALDQHLHARAWGTLGASAVIVCGSVAAWLVPDGRLAAWLLKDNAEIRAGEVWRLLTVAFVHASVLHLVFNVSVYLSTGALLERLAGARRQLLVLAAGTVAGSLLSVACLPASSVGASGGVLAVAAAVVAFSIRHRALFPAPARARLFGATVQLVALNAVLTFVLSNVDWAAHVGGLLCGAVLGWFATPVPATLRSLAASAVPGVGPSPLPREGTASPGR